MVGCRSSRLNLNKPFSGPVSTLMSSSADFYSFSLSGRLRAVGLNALTRLSTLIYMICVIKSLYLLRQSDVDDLVNCAIKSLYLLRQCDVDNLLNKQFQFQTKCYHVRFIKIYLSILSLVGPFDRILSPLNVLAVGASFSSLCHLVNYVAKTVSHYIYYVRATSIIW